VALALPLLNKDKRRGRYCLLITDGYGSHLTFDLVLLVSQLDIIILLLPPHSTHLTQPLDLVCFAIEKHYHGKAIDDYVRHGKDAFTKMTFLQVLQQIRKLSFTKGNIFSAFRRAGIIPLNPDIVIEGLNKILARKSQAKEIKGRIYGYEKDELGRSLYIPASNKPKCHIPVALKNRFINTSNNTSNPWEVMPKDLVEVEVLY